MKDKKQPKLPRGLRWDPRSPYIFFSWRDERRKLHQKSTGTSDPEQALLFKMRFLAEQKEQQDQDELDPSKLRKLPLKRVSELYFEWKISNNADRTVEREARMFKNVLRFFGPETPIRSISWTKIRQYQQERRSHISRHMKKQVTPRTVNYEGQLLRGVMTYADCWSPDIAAHYKPLRQPKSKVGKVATTSNSYT